MFLQSICGLGTTSLNAIKNAPLMINYEYDLSLMLITFPVMTVRLSNEHYCYAQCSAGSFFVCGTFWSEGVLKYLFLGRQH